MHSPHQCNLRLHNSMLGSADLGKAEPSISRCCFQLEAWPLDSTTAHWVKQMLARLV